MSDPKVYIIVLNWNGWRDTIECLESIQKSYYSNYCVVVIDNGSHDDSCEQIISWAKGDIKVKSRYITGDNSEKPLCVVTYDRITAEKGGILQKEKILSHQTSTKRLVLIKFDENIGFAAGCNVGIKYTLAVGGAYVLLLNNDTVLEASTIRKMTKFLEDQKNYHGVTGQIRLYDDAKRVWNCGGKLTSYGTRRYYHNDSHINKVPQEGMKRISFTTCCAAMFRTSLFKNIGVLSNLFFFGEEDFELSLRLKRYGYKLACIYDAIIYHKVGSSINDATGGKYMAQTYIYYLNRFIDMRYSWPKYLWRSWRFLYFFYIFTLLKLKHRTSWSDLWSLRKALIKDSTNLDRVDRDTFKQALKFKF